MDRIPHFSLGLDNSFRFTTIFNREKDQLIHPPLAFAHYLLGLPPGEKNLNSTVGKNWSRILLTLRNGLGVFYYFLILYM